MPETLNDETMQGLIGPLTELVTAAGDAILAIRRSGTGVETKADGSPVTEADLAADRIINDGLARLVPAIPVISEERTAAIALPVAGTFFVIDPLDGTKEFIAGRDEFTVNLAVVRDGEPVAGIVGAPALGRVWRGIVGRCAECLAIDPSGQWRARPIRTRTHPPHGAPWVAAVSRSHGDARTEAFIDSRPGASRKTLGSALKFGRLAEGLVDIYPRLSPTSEWDVAAGYAVVTAAGGRVTDPAGARLRFGGDPGRGFIVPGFIAWGDPAASAGA